MDIFGTFNADLESDLVIVADRRRSLHRVVPKLSTHSANATYEYLCHEIKRCQLCASQLPFPAKPIFHASPKARILIAGQAPGIRVHESGIPFNDPSGDRLREWLGVKRTMFYDASVFAIIPMGFCYPGTGANGDHPPRKECAATWRLQLLAALPNIELTLAIGQYAIAWHLGKQRKKNLTETVKHWQDYAPEVIPLPHPSPRNNIWLAKNTWFEPQVLAPLKHRIKLLAG